MDGYHTHGMQSTFKNSIMQSKGPLETRYRTISDNEESHDSGRMPSYAATPYENIRAGHRAADMRPKGSTRIALKSLRQTRELLSKHRAERPGLKGTSNQTGGRTNL